MTRSARTAPARILIVEDEWLIAASLEEIVREIGCETLGPVSNVKHALLTIAEEIPDAALLDVSLGSEKSFPIADALRAHGVPFLFLTGYVTPDLPAPYSSCTLLSKPVAPQTLKAALLTVLKD